MGAFEYAALDAAGRQRKGVLEGDTPRQIRQILRERGLIPLTVEEVAKGVARRGHGLLFRRGVAPADLALITRQLATLVRAGTVLDEALATVADQTEKGRLQGIIVGVRSRVLEGHALAAAMADFPGVFPKLYRTTVGAGEQSGHLDVVLERLADYTEFVQQIRQKVMLAVLYPIILTVVAILVVGALLTYVVPKIVDVFENLHQQLPVLTRGLIQVSSFLRSYGLLLLVGLFALAVLFRLLLRREGVRLRFDQAIFRVPLIARFSRSMNAARFARTFSILTASGVPVLDGMHISAQVIGNMAMRQAVDEAASRVREGSSVHQMLAKSGYFPPITIHLIASGEASAKLEEMLERAAVNQEREVETLISTLMGVFEPLLILIMGGVVLIIVLAILLPIFDLNALVK